MKRSRVGILCALLMAACGEFVRAQAPPAGSKTSPIAIGQSQTPGRVLAKDRQNYGLLIDTYQFIPASDFDPDTSCASGCTDYTSTWNPSLNVYSYRRYLTGGQARLVAFPRLPTGALVDAIQYVYCDFGGSGRLTFNVYVCNEINDCSASPRHTHTSTAGEMCKFDFVDFPPYTVDNVHFRLLIQVGWGVSDDTLQLAGVSLGYKLQVSPAPGTPDFGDVPVSDPAFQYIHALVSSGITAGCGGNNYCPDSPITRRQMAVFLAKALGLYWPF